MTTPTTIWLHVASSALVCLLAAAICAIHRRRRRARAADYWIGAGVWTVSVATKVALALLLFGGLRRRFGAAIPLPVSVAATGLLTGTTECLFTWIVARTRRWREAGFDAMAAFGLGFGCFEALVLAAPLLLGALAGLAPHWFEATDAQALLAGLSDPVRPFTFLWERTIAVPVHLLASVLIFLSVRSARPSLFAWGFALKSAIDAVPATKGSWLEVELIYGAFGIVSTFAFLRLARASRAASTARPSKE